MRRRRDPPEVKATKGLKLKPKPRQRRKQEGDQKVVSNVENKQGDDTPPTEEALRLMSRLREFRQDLLDAMGEFNSLLSIRILPENRSTKDKEMEQNVVNKLSTAAIQVENLSPGEGLLGMCILSIRQSLTLRDAGNKLAYKIEQLSKKINDLEGQHES